jgi:3-(3-hydroxy-phenyl)propionate hydroxylase
LLDSYSDERCFAADENILNSTRATDFITPKSAASKTFRDAVLSLAQHHAFARKLVNSGRLSVPCLLSESLLNTSDDDRFDGDMAPGAPMADAPIEIDGSDGWLIDHVGNRFQGLYFCDDPAAIPELVEAQFAELAQCAVPIAPLVIAKQAGRVANARVLVDSYGLVAKRYDARDGSYYLMRPDQHVAARWRSFDPARARMALARATSNY